MIKLNDSEDSLKVDKQVFKKIFDSFYKGLILFAKKYVIDPDLAEDIVQEVFVMLWEKRVDMKNIDAVKSLLYASVRNKALNHFRHQKVIDRHHEEMKQELSQEFFFKNHLIEEETYRLVLQAITELPEQSQKVCVMSINGVKNAQIAEELEITTSTVKYHKTKVISTLKSRLSNHVYLLLLLINLIDS